MKAEYILLCEDQQTRSFVTRFLKGRHGDPVGRKIRAKVAPSGRGSGKQFVEANFVNELTALRAHGSAALIIAIDADVETVESVVQRLQNQCNARNVAWRSISEHVAFIVSRRNIETWIQFLADGVEVDEATDFPHLRFERDCRSAVANLVAICRGDSLPDNAPPSLRSACNEYRERLQPTFG